MKNLQTVLSADAGRVRADEPPFQSANGNDCKEELNFLGIIAWILVNMMNLEGNSILIAR